MESCSRPMAVCATVDGSFWVHLQLVTLQLRGVGFRRGEEENIISLSNREWHWRRLWGEEAEAGERAASLVAVLHSTRAALVMDWRQLGGGSPESIKVSSWNCVWVYVCVCLREGREGCSSFVKWVIWSNLCSPSNPRDLMANNGLKLEWFVVTKKPEITLSASPHPHQAFVEFLCPLKLPDPFTFAVMTRWLIKPGCRVKGRGFCPSPLFSSTSRCPLIGR